jgi:hypothetical protein
MSACVLPFPSSNLDLEVWFRDVVNEVAKRLVEEVRGLLAVEKEWYSTDELASALGKAPFTIREKWCNSGRIDAEKDPVSGKWRIPGHEYRRLVNGGALRKPT